MVATKNIRNAFSRVRDDILKLHEQMHKVVGSINAVKDNSHNWILNLQQQQTRIDGELKKLGERIAKLEERRDIILNR